MAFAHSFPIDGAKPRDDDALSNKYPDPFRPVIAPRGVRQDGGTAHASTRGRVWSACGARGHAVVLKGALGVNFQEVVHSVRQRASAG